MDTENHEGGCMCGAVRYESAADSTWNVYCHCESCRKHTGAPVVAFVRFPLASIRWTRGERAIYESSPGRRRGFCRDCGTPLTWETEVKGEDWLVIHVSTLDHPERFAPTEHVFYAERAPWLEIDDGLPRYDGSKYI